MQKAAVMRRQRDNAPTHAKFDALYLTARSRNAARTSAGVEKTPASPAISSATPKPSPPSAGRIENTVLSVSSSPMNTGVRPANGQVGDQKRVVTPRAALDAGASILVVGRPITQSNDPDMAAREIEATL